MRTPNFVMKQLYTAYKPNAKYGDSSIAVPEGMFVRPIQGQYVPKHCIETWKISLDDTHYCYVYCRYGILPVPRDSFREVL